MSSSSESADEIKARLNLETSRIHWHNLQTFYARGQVVRVAANTDLLTVASELASDNKAQFEQWLASGKVGDVTPDLARDWYQSNTELWAVVIAPWVLVQDRADGALH